MFACFFFRMYINFLLSLLLLLLLTFSLLSFYKFVMVVVRMMIPWLIFYIQHVFQVANSNSQSQHLSKMISVFSRRLERIKNPSVDGEVSRGLKHKQAGIRARLLFPRAILKPAFGLYSSTSSKV